MKKDSKKMLIYAIVGALIAGTGIYFMEPYASCCVTGGKRECLRSITLWIFLSGVGFILGGFCGSPENSTSEVGGP